jgi:hypothetical protein
MKREGCGILVVLTAIILLCVVTLPKNGFVAQSTDKISLETLRASAAVECLQNSQCSGSSECMDTQCVKETDINQCQTINLNTPTRQIKVGDSINSIKEVLTKADLPFLLSGGEFVKIVNGKTMEYFYNSVILIGDNKIEQESDKYVIQNDTPIYTYRLTFSNGVDFSDKDIQGQTIRILGQEYIINSNSDNSNIYLVSNKTNIQLQNKNNINIIKDENGNVIRIEIAFVSQAPVDAAQTNTDSVFNSAKLSFNSVDANAGFASIQVGGVC